MAKSEMVQIEAQVTEWDKRVVSLLSDGFTVKEIANKMRLNGRTLESKIFHLRNKMDCQNLTSLVALFLREKLIS